MSFRQLTHHPTLFRSIRAACDGGRAASAREPEGESAQEPEREAAEEEAAAEAAEEEAAEEAAAGAAAAEEAVAEEEAEEEAEEAVWAQHGSRYMASLPTPGVAAEAEWPARRCR